MKALCLVAHPDDCVIFAYSFIHNHPELHWTICYLTSTEDAYGQQRVTEIENFWNKRGIQIILLGYNDDYRDNDNQCISFDVTEAYAAVQYLCQNYNIVLTHNADGDYGHIHHKFVHNCVPQDHCHVITFAQPGQGTDTYSIPDGFYSLDELPLLGKIVQGFHVNEHVNSYSIFPATKILLGLEHN